MGFTFFLSLLDMKMMYSYGLATYCLHGIDFLAIFVPKKKNVLFNEFFIGNSKTHLNACFFSLRRPIDQFSNKDTRFDRKRTKRKSILHDQALTGHETDGSLIIKPGVPQITVYSAELLQRLLCGGKRLGNRICLLVC